MFRRTKIVTTLGPATDDDAVLELLLLAGANMVRLNFSHGSASEHKARAERVRHIAAKHDLSIAIMGDLQGPKIRIAAFEHEQIMLHERQDFCLDTQLDKHAGNESAVGLAYKDLPKDVEPNDLLLLDDGRIQLRVLKVSDTQVHCRVEVGGKLSNNKGINKQGGGLSAAALTEKDKNDIQIASEIGVDYLAVSFPRNGEDMRYARQLAQNAGLYARLVAKVERAETVASEEAMIDIIDASDAVMVARGDLGVEIGDPALVGVQKALIRLSRKRQRAVITATQMMESMINAPLPTRAEVMDVANAVLDGTDAVMLSGETAAGKYPVQTVAAMSQVCLGAEKQRSINVAKYPIDTAFSNIGEAIAMATMYTANNLKGVSAIIALTETGNTPLLLSRLSSGLPIFSLSAHPDTLTRCALYRGVYPLYFQTLSHEIVAVASDAIDMLKEREFVKTGDRVILTHGDVFDQTGHTNTCKILDVL